MERVDMMDTEQILKLVSPLLTATIGAIIKYYTEEKSKLISFVGHVSAFKLQDEQKTDVFTHSIIVRNAGRKTAKNIKLGHNLLPENIKIFPEVQYTIETTPSGSSEIAIPALVPKEQITVSYLYFPPVTWNQINTYTKSDDGFAKIIDVIPIPRHPRWALFVAWYLIFVGASALLYWLLKIIANFI